MEKMEIHHKNWDLYRTFKVGKMVFYNMQSIQLLSAISYNNVT